MSFCPKCGRQLSDGEVCNCQAQNTQQVQPDAQTQSTQQAPRQTWPMVKELTDLLSGIFKKPADAVKKYVSNASMEAPAILILVLAFISALGELLRMLYINFTTKSSLKSLADLANLISGKTKAYSAGQIAAGFFTHFVEVIAIAALTAAIIMLIINAFEKDKKVTICAKTPANRWLKPEELAGPAVFLASEASDAVNGHILYVDGGILAYIGKQPQ